MTDINHNAGLVNFGNTCFMNASLQLLLCAKHLNLFLISDNINLSNDTINKYIQTWKDYMHSDTKILGPNILYHQYMQLNTSYTGFTQEDSHEFLIYTLDDINEQIKLINNKLFTIKFNQTVFYKNKNETSITQVNENLLSLPVTDDTNSLLDCLNLYKFQNEDDFTITYDIMELPLHLFIGLKRFKIITNGNNIGISKNTKQLDIPLKTEIFGNKYKLKGFVMHSGGPFGGHYYAYGCKKINSENKWFCYNDTNVSESSLEHAENEVKSAYILLYTLYDM